MRKRVILALAVALSLSGAGVADDTKNVDPAKGEKAVKEQLEKYKADSAQVMLVKDEGLAKALPRHIFFTAHFRQFPVARLVPEPLKSANLFAYSADGKATLLNDVKALEKFFKENAAPAKDLDPGKAAVRAWLKLSSELHQDGFFRFAIMDDSTRAELVQGVVSASGKVVVMQGGNGELNAKLRFDQEGKLARVEEESKIRPGPRPICQATKLLDADPLVRKMAEQDLLIMGKFARGYLDEQRLKASPDLRKVIDRLWQRIVEEDR
jgi:hypothetical protein